MTDRTPAPAAAPFPSSPPGPDRPPSVARPLALLLLAPLLMTVIVTLWAVVAAALVAGTLFAGVVEESVWRGYAIRRFAAHWSAGLAVALSSILFGLLHWGLGWEGIVITGINGALLAGLFLWRKNLLAPAVAHAAVNALVLVF